MPLFKSCPSPSNFESQEANKKVRTWNTQKTKDPSQGSRSRPPWLVFSAESWLLQLQAACACMCHDKIMDEKRVGDGHQSIHRGLYIYICPLEGFPLWDGGPYLIWLFFHHGMLFLKLSSFSRLFRGYVRLPGQFCCQALERRKESADRELLRRSLYINIPKSK